MVDEKRMAEEEQAFQERFTARWADLDANRHLRNTLFSEFATHTRFRLLQAHGFSQAAFEARRFGPVMFREEIRYPARCALARPSW